MDNKMTMYNKFYGDKKRKLNGNNDKLDKEAALVQYIIGFVFHAKEMFAYIIVKKYTKFKKYIVNAR